MKRSFIPFGYKLMLTYFLFVLIPVIIVGSFSYQSSINSAREQTRQNLQGTLSQIRDNIMYKMKEAERVSEQLYFDEQLQSFLRNYEDGWDSLETTKKYLMPMFSNAINVFSQPALLKVYINNTSIPEVYSDQDPNRNPLKVPGYEILYLKRLEEQEWFKTLELPAENDKGISWLQVENDKTFSNISVIRRLMDFDRQKYLGITRTVIGLEDLLESVDYLKIGEKSSLFVLNKSGSTLKASGMLNGDSLETETSGNTNLRIEESVHGVDWKIVAMVPNSLLEKDAKNVLRITILLGAASIIIVLVIGLLVSNYYSKRVRKIVYSLHAFKEGDFQKRIRFKWNDEFAQIADAFNKMGDNVEELIKEVYLANIQKKEAELESLQAQINPHFLYNTLSSISRLAKFGEIDKLHEMVLGLAKFYRLTLNKGRMLISVQKELEQAGAYIAIQNIKFRNRLQVWYDIQIEVLGYETVKLILQPFVENALEHALFGKSINIKVTAHLDQGMIIFRIIDDGIGMRQETIDQIFVQNGVNIGYGIRNVDERIKLQYGNRYGVEIYSRLGIGTCVTIRVPAEKNK
ncbi:sensor histidine kinase [Cohnella sp.]|uniref:cache domain-containing sensor histidine kinase n=1 Tax=Cohnella sp. TaxID=1883426 RepID=UPI003567BBCF